MVLETKLPSGKTKKCKLHDVLYVPKLSYNLLSVSRTSDAGKTTRFGETSCQILDGNRKPVAVATRVGDLYYLSCRPGSKKSHTAVEKGPETREDVWHRRYGHLGTRNLQKLANQELVNGFDYDVARRSISVSHVWKGNTTVTTSQPLVESAPRNHSVWCTVIYVER